MSEPCNQDVTGTDYLTFWVLLGILVLGVLSAVSFYILPLDASQEQRFTGCSTLCMVRISSEGKIEGIFCVHKYDSIFY